MYVQISNSLTVKLLSCLGLIESTSEGEFTVAVILCISSATQGLEGVDVQHAASDEHNALKAQVR